VCIGRKGGGEIIVKVRIRTLKVVLLAMVIITHGENGR